MADQFATDHAPGSMTVTASGWPCLVLPPEHRPGYMPSAYSYALHLTGREPLPQGDPKILRRGHLLEPIGLRLLEEDHGIHASEVQVRRERPDVPALTYLDALADPVTHPGWAIEMKSMPEYIYRDRWADGPPWHVRVQTQAQMAVDQTLVGVLIVPIVMSYAGAFDVPTVYEEARSDEIGAMLVVTARAFLDGLRRDPPELPGPDATAASYEAFRRVVEIDPTTITTLADDEDAEKWDLWQIARQQRLGGEKLEDAAKRYFAMRGGDASILEIPGRGQITRKRVTVKAETTLRPARDDLRWTIKEATT